MSLSNVNIEKINGGLARLNATTDGVSGLIHVQSGGTFNYGTYKLSSPEDAVSASFLNITADTIGGGQVLKYHIDQYFAKSDSPLYVKTITGTSTYAEIVSLKDYSVGEINQVAVIDYDKNFATATLQTIQTVVEQTEDEEAPLVALYLSKVSSATTISSLSDLKSLECDGVSFCIAEDMSTDSRALELKTSGATVVGAIGALLGTVSANQVHQDAGAVAINNLVDLSGEWQTPGFITGELLSSVSKTLQNTLDTYHYIFARKFVGLSGSYFNFGWSAGLATSDFNTIENNRTYNKAFRLLRANLLPAVNGSLYVDKSGYLSIGTVKYFKTLCDSALQQMKNLGELSGFVVSIDPKQKPLSTNSIEIVCKIQPVGVAKSINVTLGFTLSLV